MFYIELTVRDYECDQQGIVNNAVYLNYLQYARHEYGRSTGWDWLDMTAQGINFVLSRVEMDYLHSLHAGDQVRITVKPIRKGKYKLFFEQEIIRLPDKTLVLKALMKIACLIDGKPSAPEAVDAWFGKS